MRPQPAFAFDFASVRSFDRDGRLRVSVANISMAAVNPYLGSEIPDGEALGLDPDRIYRLHRAAGELARAVPTFVSLPLLRRHVPVSADDHKPTDIVGSVGSDVRFDEPYLTASLIVWAADAIRGIEDGSCAELSAGYRYVADMRPGRTPEGQPFDGVMRDIIGNHLALVGAGRCGPTVVVGDGAAVSNATRRFFEMYPDAKRIGIL